MGEAKKRKMFFISLMCIGDGGWWRANAMQMQMQMQKAKATANGKNEVYFGEHCIVSCLAR
jgi:hypothetical protein